MAVAVVDVLGAVEQHDLGQGGQDGGECRAGEDEPDRIGALADAFEEEDQSGGGGGTDEAEHQIPGHAHDPEQRDSDGDRGRGAGVDPEQTGFGQRIAGQGLHDRSGGSECESHDHGVQRAGFGTAG